MDSGLISSGKRQNARGFIVVAVLWILAALSALVLIYLTYVTNTAVVVAVSADRVQAEALESAGVDARRRKIIWPDGKRLSIEQSAQRIHAQHPDMSRELIETHLCSWLEHCVPESYSERQLDELDRLVGPWIRDHERKSHAAIK